MKILDVDLHFKLRYKFKKVINFRKLLNWIDVPYRLSYFEKKKKIDYLLQIFALIGF
jgi:hypothetical protein